MPPVVPAKTMDLVGVTTGQVFKISKDPTWPTIVLTTNMEATVAHTWKWEIKWKTFTKSGSVNTPGNSWDATTTFQDLGGDITLTVQAGPAQKTFTLKIEGEQPTASDIKAYVLTKVGVSGFDKLIEHESKFKHFDTKGYPIKSFDNGYGMCQLTSPAPTYEEVWNWKKNVDGGVKLYQIKQNSARNYLSQSARTFTDSQLKYETICRWNGGAYHVWDATALAWVRNGNILCDSLTGNIGWDMTEADNKGKTEADLHKRDARPKGGYDKRKAGDNWIYSGVCYADAILD